MGNRNKKLLVFDVDGTIAPHGRPLERAVAEALCALEKCGHIIGFASGKDAEYLDGLARGIGLESRVIIAENGGIIFYEGRVHVIAERPAFFDRLKNEISQLYPEVRLQHNMVNLTAMATGEALEAISAYFKNAGVCDGKNCRFYLHSDSAELLPNGVDKGRALAELKRMTGFDRADVIAAGNAHNDEPMRGETGLFLAVGDEIEADRRFENAYALMAYLFETCM